VNLRVGSEPILLGCDFSSSPTPKKQIVLAVGRLVGGLVQLQELKRFATLSSWSDWLSSRSWVGGFDLPFGLPRAWVESQNWPTDWLACSELFAATPKEQLRQRFQAYCNARPPGKKFAHRATDGVAGSSPSMKWVNPPVAWMMHAGLPRLQAVGAWFPAHQPPPVIPPERLALEAYPGLLAREVLGRTSYKADDPSRQDASRLLARKTLLEAMEQGRTRLGLRLKLTVVQAGELVADPTGDALDAALCLMQAAWAQQRAERQWGLPPDVDPLEGWIVSA
jgi:Protein of unknown function (DUF429)